MMYELMMNRADSLTVSITWLLCHVIGIMVVIVTSRGAPITSDIPGSTAENSTFSVEVTDQNASESYAEYSDYSDMATDMMDSVSWDPMDHEMGYETLDELLTPPRISLTQDQINEVSLAENELASLHGRPELLRNQYGLNRPIVNITEEQIEALLPFYGSVFRQPTGIPSEQTRRSVSLRICPASTKQFTPQLGINGGGNVVQIVQLHAMNISQVFFEETCEFAVSPVAPVVCQEVSRLQSALVIDLQTFMFATQYIEIGYCAGFKIIN